LPRVELIVIQFLILVLSLSFHEAAHAWTADRLGDRTARLLGRLTLNPLAHIDWIGTVLFPLVGMFSGLPVLGWAKPVPVDMRNLSSPKRDFAVVAAAGPASNLLLAVAATALFKAGVPAAGDAMGTAGNVLLLAVVINTLLAVFNMIPVPPLDGGNVAIGLLPAPLSAALAQLRPWGFLILYGLLIGGVLDRIVFPVQNRLVEFLVGG
jgi:Zn-dependent protease